MAETLYTKAKTDELLGAKAASSHTHAVGDITGVVPRAQLGTGTPSAGRYVDGGTGAWTALPSGGTINDTNASTTNTYSSSKIDSLLSGKANSGHTHAGMVTMSNNGDGTVTFT